MYFYKLIKDGKAARAGIQSFSVQETEIIKSITQEEHNSLVAEWKAHAEAVQSYAEQIQNGEIKLDDVPKELRAEVEEIVTAPVLPTEEEVESLLQKVSEI